MFTSDKKKYLLGTATAVLVLVAAVLFLPGFSGQTPPPETIGGDIVRAGADFTDGEQNGTGITPMAGSDELALALQSSSPRGEYISEPEETDYSFNALGLHWKADLPEGARVDAEVRFSQDGTSWGDWIRINIDDPDLPDHIGQTSSAGETIGQLAFADEARFYQYRLDLQANPAGESPAVTRLTASYIDAKGYHESPLSIAKVSRFAEAALEPSEASAAPGIITRAQWGANEAYMQWTPEYQQVKKIIIHHTVTSNSDPDPAATVRSIYYYHAVSLGWGDIGYNFLIDRQGRIYEGRYGGNGVIGGHALSWNSGSIGISALGNYEEGEITPAMYNAFVELMAWKSNVNLVAPWGNDYHNGTYSPNYLGHRDVGQTACPGGYLYAHLNGFRNDAHARYSPVPMTSPFIEKWNALNGAPGAAIIEQYPVTGGKAQDFQSGRLIWNQASGITSWVYGGILGQYDLLGKWNSFLGLPTSDEYGIGAGRASNFDNGRIYWSPTTNAREVHGGILAKYLAVGGPTAYGFPITDEYDVPGRPENRESDFQDASIIFRGSQGTFLIRGDVMRSWQYWGTWNGLGLPVSDDYDVPGLVGIARVADFENGRIYWSWQVRGHAIWYGPFYDKYTSLGGPTGTFAGLPVNDDYAASSGRAQDLERSTMTWSSAIGAKVVYGGIRGVYLLAGGPTGLLGLATTDEIDVAGVPGARESDFENGRIYWSGPTDAHEVYGGILGTYLVEMGGPSGFLGLPVTGEMDVSGVPGARENRFQRGRIYWSPSTESHEVYGGILGTYLAEMGGPSGFLGLPVTGEMDVSGVPDARENRFQRGRIYWSPSTDSHEVYGGIMGTYLAEMGGPSGFLGLPVTGEMDVSGVPGARESQFQRGRIYWSPSTESHEVYGGILGKYLVYGGPSGLLGLPATGEMDVSGVPGARENRFQRGRIYWSGNTGDHAVYGGVLLKYLEVGGPTSALGLPVSEEYGYAGGRRSDFQGGYIYWSASGGAQVFINSGTSVTSDSSFEVRNGSGALIGTLGAGQVVSVSYNGGIYNVSGSGISYSGSSYIRLASPAGGIMQVTSYHDVPSWNPSLDDNRFRGTIEIRYSNYSNKLWIVNELPVEQYLKGIAETSSGSPVEFLKTMSVAARTYAIWHLDRGGKYTANEVFHLKNSRNGNGDDQVYRGYGLESRFPDLVASVNNTAGQAVTYGGSVAITPYFSNSDGRTRSAQEAWGVSYWPWLQSVPDPDCNGMTLNGHGVGLSGTGALARAGRGDSYTAILSYYYTGTTVSTLDTARNIRIAIAPIS